MVPKRGLDYGFNGCDTPFIPRAPRSVRRRGTRSRTCKDGHISAFELLATLAGKLLQESEGSSASSSAAAVVGLDHCGDAIIKLEVQHTDKRFGEHDEHGSSEESAFISRNCKQRETNSSAPEIVSEETIVERASVWRPDTKMKATPSPTCYADRGIRKLLPSKYWELGPKIKDSEVGNTGVKTKNVHPVHKPLYERERSQRDTPFKKRKLYDQSSILTYDGGNSSESASNSPEKDIGITKRGWDPKFHTGTPVSASMTGRKKSPTSSDSNVKFTIKSFKVPGLLIEVPETTTVGSLKRTIVDAVTAILGGGLRVGMLLHGKRVRDDNRTLQEAGISLDENMSTLGFLLEPRSTPAQPSPSVVSKSPLPLACANSYTCRPHTISPDKNLSLSSTADRSSHVTDSDGSCGDNSQDSLAPCPTPLVLGIKSESDSRALMPVGEGTKEPLPVVPVNPRPRRPEIGQRRTRRPFSVWEVEALVEAVEKLGTGRWRDVKLCSFENAKHRTYVDLKDKWKTLVHTARITPQQRRGEPVPQELLDRVLAAHAYWTQNQTKQHAR